MKITYLYDPLERLVEVAWDDGRRVLYTYDAAGNRLSVNPVGWAPQIGQPAVAAQPRMPAAPQGQVFCPNCGAQVSPGVKFCRQCGTRL